MLAHAKETRQGKMGASPVERLPRLSDAGRFALAGKALDDFPEDSAERDALQDRVTEVGVQVHCVVMTPALTLNCQHVRAPQVPYEAPYRALRERHVVCNLPDGAAGFHSDVEKDCPVTGDQVPVIVDRCAISDH